MSMLLRASLRHLAGHPAQTGLAVLGVALGVGLVVAVDLARGSAERAFLLSTETLQGRATHVVRGGPAGLPEELYGRLLREHELVAAPVIEAQVQVRNPATGVRRSVTLLGVDPFAERAFRAYLAAGAALSSAETRDQPAGSHGAELAAASTSEPLDLRSWLLAPGACVLAQGTARELGVGSLPGRSSSSSEHAGSDRPRDRKATPAGGPSAEALEPPRTAGEASGEVVAGGEPASLPASPAASRPRPQLELVGPEGTQRVELVGFLAPSDEATRVGLAGLLACDLATAQELLGWATTPTRPGRLSRIDLRLADGPRGERELAAATSLVAAAASSSAPGAVLEPAGSRSRTMLAMTGAFRTNLLALALLALLCGTFLIFNTVSFSVVQRRGWIGRLRALGVTRGEIGRLVLGEALVLGVVGSLLGIGGGVLLGHGLVGLVTRTIEDLYFRLGLRELAVAPTSLLAGFALGVSATLLAAAWPAREATSAPPRLVQLRSTLESAHQQRAPRLAAAGLALLAGGLLALALTRGLAASFAGVFAVLVGASLLVPLAVVGASRLLAPPLGWLFGGLGRMAARGLATSLSRTGVAVAALAVAVAVAVGVGLMITSFRGSVVRWLDVTLQADLYVTPTAGAPGNAAVAMDEALIAAVARLPGVARMNRLRAVSLVDRAGTFQLVALDMDRRSESAFELLAGEPALAWAAWREGAGVMVSEPLATKRRLRVGSRLALPGDRREPLPVLAIYRDYASDQGAVLLTLELYRERFADPAISAVSLFAATTGATSSAPSADHGELVARLAGAVREVGAGRLAVQSNHELRRASMTVFDRTFEVTAVLRLLTAGVAFAGVLAALLALALERQRELGVLRALGLLRRQVLLVVSAQTALLGLVAGLVAVPLGAGLAAIMVHVINRRSFGWSMDLVLAPGQLLEAVLLALAAALVAGLYPAWRMARTSPAEALRTE
jgi:putative ABC transport system permease protein